LSQPEKDEVKEINEAHRESHKPNTHGTYSGADNSKILTTDEEEKEATRKKEVLQGMIQEEVSKMEERINVQLQQIPNIIQQSIQSLTNQNIPKENIQPQEPLTVPGPSAPPGAALAAIDPSVMAPLMTGLAQLIQAWKGGSQAPVTDEFGNMFKQLGINIMQAGVDGIYKNVYDGYQPQPRNNQLQAGNLQSQTPNNNNQRSTGFV